MKVGWKDERSKEVEVQTSAERQQRQKRNLVKSEWDEWMCFFKWREKKGEGYFHC